MRVAIVGSRNYKNYQEFLTLLDEPKIVPTHIVSGGAEGADTMAAKFARGAAIPITIYFPNWTKHGKPAGMIRNKQIIDDCEVLIAFPSPKSVGTRNTISLAEAKGIPTHVFEVMTD